MTGTDPTLLTAHLRALTRTASPTGGLPDAELIRRFADSRDEAAFEVLVWRHGPMVWSTCCRILRHRQDVEDAFQAAFLALARSARSLRGHESVAAWLHRVATHAALKVKARRRPTAELTADVPEKAPGDPADRELAAVLDQELNRLPDHYRTAFVLCCLEGLTNTEAARELGCPVGTVDSRLHAARTRLRDRLARRGFGPAAVAGATAVVAVPPAVSAAAIAFGTATRTPPPAVSQLAAQLGRTMSRPTVTLLATATFVGLALTAAALWASEPPPPAPLPDPARPALAPAPRPREAGPALLFTELVVKPGETGSRTLRLSRATFKDGKIDARDDLHTGDASEFGFDGRYRLIGDRFVVLQSATVVDVGKKKVHYSFDRGHVVAVEGTAMYFYNTKDGGPAGVLRYDAATGVVDKVAEPGAGRWGLRGAVSPRGTKAIVREWKAIVAVEQPYTLFLDRVGKPRESLGEFAATHGMTGGGTFNDIPPGVWLDDDRFLTQTTLGKVVILNTAEKKQEKVVEIALTHKPGEKAWETIGAIGFTPLGLQQPRFSLLPDGRVVYEADVVYFIDVAKKTWEKAVWRSLGHGFEYSAVPDKIKDVDRYTKTVTVTLRHKGKAIGTSETVWWTTTEKPRVLATDGYVAVIERVKRPGFQTLTDAVRVWSAAIGEWVTLDGWADSLIGWVK